MTELPEKDKPQAGGTAAPGPGNEPGVGPSVAAVLGLAAAWIAAGSAGLFGDPYRRGLAWALSGAVLVAAWPKPERTKAFLGAVAIGLLMAVPMLASGLRPVNVLAVVVLVAAAAQGQSGASKTVLQWSAEAIGLLALYRVACTSIPLVWLAADGVAGAMGQIAGTLTRYPLWVGPTYAGIDLLIPMIYLAIRGPLSPLGAPGGRERVALRFGLALLAVAVGQLIYLDVLSIGPAVYDKLPASSPPGSAWNPHPLPPGLDAAVARWTPGKPLDFLEPVVRVGLRAWFPVGQSLRDWFPWNMPVLAVVIQAIVAWLILRWLSRFPEDRKPAARWRFRWLREGALGLAAVTLAALLPVVTTLSWHHPSLQGKKFVLFEKGYLNWEKPKHGSGAFNYGQYSVGMYGMMPILLRSLGAEAIISPELSEADLAGADVVVVIFPDKPWSAGQIERIERFVERGGTLLVLGEHTILKTEMLKAQDEELGTQLSSLYEKLEKLNLMKRVGRSRGTTNDVARQEEDLRAGFDERELCERLQAAAKKGPLNRFNELLRNTDMSVRFDSATFAIGGWLQSYEALSHPASAGISDAMNQFGVVIGASVAIHRPREGRWPASPLLIGRFGWNDPGNPLNYPSLMASISHEPRYDAGERLGDIILAAEQRVGDGRVVVFGDTSGFTNGISMGAHVYTSRLFAYLADPAASPQEPDRQVAGLILAAALAAALLLWSSCLRLVSAALALAISLSACTALTHQAWEILPDGRGAPGTPNNLAYIDEAHLGHFSPESWRDDGLMGLALNLMRNDYLTLMLPELTRRRLLVPEVDLGIKVEPVSERAARQMKIEPGQGVVVTQLERGKAAERSGLALPAVILGVNGQPVASAGGFQAAVDAVPRDGKIILRVFGREASPVLIPKSTPRARLLISVAPGREFSASERETIRDFISAGGIFISTVGCDDVGPSRKLLEELGFYVGGRKWKWLDRGQETGPTVHFKAGANGTNWEDPYGEPKPLGYFKSPYFNGGDFLAFVRFYAAWPLDCDDPDQLLITYYPPDVPVIVLRRYGAGLATVIGDTAFAQNRNLENRDGSPFDGMRENAVFWRWFLALVRDGMGEGRRWFPKKSDTVPAEGSGFRVQGSGSKVPKSPSGAGRGSKPQPKNLKPDLLSPKTPTKEPKTRNPKS